MFVHRLRAQLRRTVATAVVTAPTSVMSESAAARLRHAADVVVHLSSFAGAGIDVPPAFSMYDGVCTVRKLPRMNTLTPVLPDTLRFAFSVRKSFEVVS